METVSTRSAGTPSSTGLASNGIETSAMIHWNLPSNQLVDLAVERGEGSFSANQALVTETGDRTGR